MDETAAEAGLRVLGLTGGVASGKSTAARMLAEALGGAVLDADAIVQELLESSQVLDDIEDKVGVPVRTTDGTLDRAALAERVFADPQARTRLEAVLHPAVRRRIWHELAALEATGAPIWAVLDVPLLREGGLDALCDRVLHVDAPPEQRATRAHERHGWDRDTWEAREAAQLAVAEKRARADAILVNDAEPEALRGRIDALLPSLRELPPRPLRARWPAWDTDPERQTSS